MTGRLMQEPDEGGVAEDVVESIAGIVAGSDLQGLRQRRAKVAAATQGSYLALFDPSLPGLPLIDRLLVALHACLLSASPALAAHYRERLLAVPADARLVGAVERLAFHEALPAGQRDEWQAAGKLAVEEDARDADKAAEAAGGPLADDLDRLRAILSFVRLLIEEPAGAEEADLQPLRAAGLDTAAVVALAQLVAFLSYQVRLIAGLTAMKSAAAAATPSAQVPSAQVPSASAPIAANSSPASTPLPAEAADGAGTEIIRVGAFTNQALEWKAWLDVVDLERASAEQVAVLEESHPQAKVQDYYRLLVHQPEILRQRSAAFNAIMYAPRGLSRAERELGATVASRINGCVYCASVHARRFEQMARRNQVIRQVFEDPPCAGAGEREQAVVRFSIALTRTPARIATPAIDALAHAGLDDLEILDLIHAVAIFAWANRLMLTLGEPSNAAPA